MYGVNNIAKEWLTLRHLMLLTCMVNVHDCGDVVRGVRVCVSAYIVRGVVGVSEHACAAVLWACLSMHVRCVRTFLVPSLRIKI